MMMLRAESPRPVARHKAAAAATAPAAEEAARPPLLPAEKNSSAVPGVATRKPRPREVTSSYNNKSGGTAQATGLNVARCPSPTPGSLVGAAGPSILKRAVSAERRRPATPSFARRSVPSLPSSTRPSTPSSPPASTARPSTLSSPAWTVRASIPSTSRPSTPSSSRPSTPVRDSAVDPHLSSRRLISHRSVDGLWPSIRSLSSSFQSDSASSGNKPDRVTPDPKSKPAVGNALSERKRTPLRGRHSTDHSENSKPVENSHSSSRPVEQKRWPAISTRAAKLLTSAAMTRSVDLTPSRLIPSRGISPRRLLPAADGSPTKCLQKTDSGEARRMSLDGLSRTGSSESSSSPRSPSDPPNRPSSASRSCPSRTQSLPSPALSRPASPSKVSLPLTSSPRGSSSPSRTRPSTPQTSLSSAMALGGLPNSALSYILDVRKGKKNAIEDVHQLRLLYNRHLQWRFVNAGAETALTIQKFSSEKALYNTWLATSELQYSVTAKKIEIIRLQQFLKLSIILEDQMSHLDEWISLEREHFTSLSRAIEALKASTIRLPITGGARADFLAMKNALSSALDVMQAMGTSICYLLPRVEDTNSMLFELATVAGKERAMLDQCRDLLASASAVQVQESSLRTHLLQMSPDIVNVG